MKRMKSVVLAAMAVFIAIAVAQPAAPASALASSSSLSIVPKKEYLIEPGKSVSDKLTIRNLDVSDPLQLRLRVVDFTYTDDTGTPKLFLDENAPQTTWSLKPFMTVPETVTIPPRGTKTLDMKVAIPAGHGAGSYYSAIVYSSGSGEGGNVGLSASGVTLAFVSVPGKVHEDLRLEKFGAFQPPSVSGESGYRYVNHDEPLRLAYTLKNNGNVTEAPVGSITIKNLFGPETTIGDVNPNKSLALIGQSRTFTACIKKKDQAVDFEGTRSEASTCISPGLWPGYYTANLNLYYGQNGNNTKEVSGVGGFWYLPWWFILLCLVVILLVGFGIWRTVNKVRGKMNGGVKIGGSRGRGRRRR